MNPTADPTANPTTDPTANPTADPTANPTTDLGYGRKCATDEMTPSACQVCDFRADEHDQHCHRCLGGKFLHSNRCRDDCDGLEGLVRIADHLGPDPGTNCLDDHLGTRA